MKKLCNGALVRSVGFCHKQAGSHSGLLNNSLTKHRSYATYRPRKQPETETETVVATSQQHSRADIVKISIIGVGGAGGNAVRNMVKSGVISAPGVNYIVCNTDAQALAESSFKTENNQSPVHLLHLGSSGLGAGSRPEIGRQAAYDSIGNILDKLEGSHMVFITAGMGGGTGTGAAPVIAREAKQRGILTVGVVTKPFGFEGQKRMQIALDGLKELRESVDTLLVISNQKLFSLADARTPLKAAFMMADDVLLKAVKSITDLILLPGLINLDFADVRSVMSDMGSAMMGTGEAEGDAKSEDRGLRAAEQAIVNPLLEDVTLQGAKGVLINVTGGHDMTLHDVNIAGQRVKEEVDPGANIIFGSTLDENMKGKIRVSIVATGMPL